LKTTFDDYVKLSKSLKFNTYTLIANSPFITIVVYVANLSIIFINHMGMDLTKFSYYQASTMGTFIIFSLLSSKLIANKGMDFTKNLGSILALCGAISIFWVSQIDKHNANLICLSMAFIAAGGAMVAGTYGMQAISIFPNMNGTAMAMMTAIRQLLAAGLVLLSEILFDGTIVPVALIIFGYAIVTVICYAIVSYLDKNKLVSA
jgi:DHA1 family bicyclomycin/chloramphenicol resistance-like MFS transporter